MRKEWETVTGQKQPGDMATEYDVAPTSEPDTETEHRWGNWQHSSKICPFINSIVPVLISEFWQVYSGYVDIEGS